MIEANQQTVAAGVSLLVGLLTAYRRYQRTGHITLSRLPWRAFRRLVFEFRRTFFTVAKPDKPSFTVDMRLDTVRATLGNQSYNPAWPLSYNYHGEDYNARHYYYDVGREYPHRQIHVRGFEREDGAVEVMAHEEPAPEHHPKAHLREDDMRPANEWVRETLAGGQRDAG